MRGRIVMEMVLNGDVYHSTDFLACGSGDDGNVLLRSLQACHVMPLSLWRQDCMKKFSGWGRLESIVACGIFLYKGPGDMCHWAPKVIQPWNGKWRHLCGWAEIHDVDIAPWRPDRCLVVPHWLCSPWTLACWKWRAWNCGGNWWRSRRRRCLEHGL